MDVDRPTIEARLQAVLAETLDSTDWTLTETTDGYRIDLIDRTITVDAHETPAETIHWVLTLRADGKTVSKFGPYADTATLAEQLCTVLDSDVLYTVCCDGSPE